MPSKNPLPLFTPAQQMLIAMNSIRYTGEIYGGTVPAHVKHRRRAANKVARRQRAVNRSR